VALAFAVTASGDVGGPGMSSKSIVGCGE